MENIIKYIVLWGLIDCGYSKRYSAFFNITPLLWEDARNQNRLVGEDTDVSLQDVQITLPEPTNTFGWIDAMSAYQPWMEVKGCCSINALKIQLVSRVENGRQLVDCVARCSGYTYIGLQQTKCACIANLTSSDVISNCQSQFCSSDDDSLCAVDSDDHQYVYYTRSGLNVEKNIGGCLAVTIKVGSNTPVIYEPAPCSTPLYPLCALPLGIPYPIFTQYTWNGAVTACTGQTVPASLSGKYNSARPYTADATYWVAQVRKAQYSLTKDFVPGVENYCVATRVRSDGTLQTFMQSCRSSLPSLCLNSTTGRRGGDNGNTPKLPPQNTSNGLLFLYILVPVLLIFGAASLIGWMIWRHNFAKPSETLRPDNNSTDISVPSQANAYSKIPDYPSAGGPQEKEMMYYSINEESLDSFYDDSEFDQSADEATDTQCYDKNRETGGKCDVRNANGTVGVKCDVMRPNNANCLVTVKRSCDIVRDSCRQDTNYVTASSIGYGVVQHGSRQNDNTDSNATMSSNQGYDTVQDSSRPNNSNYATASSNLGYDKVQRQSPRPNDTNYATASSSVDYDTVHRDGFKPNAINYDTMSSIQDNCYLYDTTQSSAKNALPTQYDTVQF